MTLCLVAMTLGVAMTSCEKEDVDADGSTTDTPLPGSITVKMRNEDNGETKIWFSSSYVRINKANNFQTGGNSGYNGYYWTQEIQIASVGKVNGLGSITTIPESGWIGQVSAFVGHGYVVRWRTKNSDSTGWNYFYTDYSYGRIFVHDEIVSTGGGVIGYTVSYIEGM